MTVIDYILQKGLVYKVVGDELNLRRCPFCRDDRYHFYINSITGTYKCHNAGCGNSGSILTFKEKLGDIAKVTSFEDLAKKKPEVLKEDQKAVLTLVDVAHEELINNKDVLRYLSGRMINKEAIKHFKLGYSFEQNTGWLWYPSLCRGEVGNIKMRSLPPADKKFRRWMGGESCLFNEDVLDQNYDEIILCEGEIDAISLWSKGIQNVIGVTIGAEGINNDWIPKLDKYQKIFFCYDNDNAGRSGSQKFSTRLGLERSYNIKLPNGYKDVNEYFSFGHRKEDFQSLINKAEPFDVENVRSIGGLIQDAAYNLTANEKETKLHLPWANVDRLIKGLSPGDLIVVGGKPGVGKTTFAFNILYYLATQGVPSLLFELEMRPERILPRIVSLHKRMPTEDVNNYEVLMGAYTELRTLPFYIAYKYSKPNWNIVSDTVRMCIRRYGIGFMVFDNLHFLCRSLAKQTEETSVMIQNFKLLAEELSIPILVIARPRKTHVKIIAGEDLKDSADIEGDADFIVVIHRDRLESNGLNMEGIFDPKTLIKLDKARWSGGGSTLLRARDDIGKFEEM